MSQQVPFPEIRGLMAKYGISRKVVGEIIGTTYQTASSKLNNQSDFSLTEMLKLRVFFIGLGADQSEVSIDRLFFAWNPYYSKENRSDGKV